MRIPESARAVLESDALGHLVTLNPDGSPQVSVVWVGLDGDEIIAAHVPNNRKVKNIRRDGRVALSIETDRVNEMGLAEYLIVNDNSPGVVAVEFLRDLAQRSRAENHTMLAPGRHRLEIGVRSFVNERCRRNRLVPGRKQQAIALRRSNRSRAALRGIRWTT